MKSSRRRFMKIVAASFAACLSLAGCGNDGGPIQENPDSTAPMISRTVPSDGAMGVSINRSVSATFNEAMNPASITSTTFTLTQGGTPVPATVSYTGTTAVLTPSDNLAVSSAFTATMTTVARDLAGNPLTVNDTWSFTTGTTAAAGPSPAILGTAGAFAILAKSAVSTTGVTAVMGDIGVSPAAATYLTGFSQSMDATLAFSTSSVVTGRLYASDYSAPTPASLTTAVLDMQIAYTDAAGRTLPDFTELGAGNIDGMILAPGLYKWGTGVTIPGGVTLAGGMDDVWIFQIAQDLSVGNGAVVTMSGGARPENVFWQVAGQATFGTTSDFKGVVLCQTMIAMNTGAVMHGRALAQTAVTLDATALTSP